MFQLIRSIARTLLVFGALATVALTGTSAASASALPGGGRWSAQNTSSGGTHHAPGNGGNYHAASNGGNYHAASNGGNYHAASSGGGHDGGNWH